MANLAGIGALNIYANEPEILAGWYHEKLGFKFDRDPKDNTHYGELRDPAAGLSVFLAIFQAKQEIPYGSRAVMITYKVMDFDNFVGSLEHRGIKIESRRGNGPSKFAIVSDPEGNPIEFWSGV